MLLHARCVSCTHDAVVEPVTLSVDPVVLDLRIANAPLDMDRVGVCVRPVTGIPGDTSEDNLSDQPHDAIEL